MEKLQKKESLNKSIRLNNQHSTRFSTIYILCKALCSKKYRETNEREKIFNEKLH